MSYYSKETISKVKTKTTDWEKIVLPHISNNRWQLTSKKTNDPIKNTYKVWIDIYQKKYRANNMVQ